MLIVVERHDGNVHSEPVRLFGRAPGFSNQSMNVGPQFYKRVVQMNL